MSVGTNVAATAPSLIKALRYHARASRLSRGAATDHSHGRKPVGGCRFKWSPVGAKESQESVAPTVLIVSFTKNPGLTPGAMICRRIRGSNRMRFARHLGQQSLFEERCLRNGLRPSTCLP